MISLSLAGKYSYTAISIIAVCGGYALKLMDTSLHGCGINTALSRKI
jgi:hypothetical protein